MTVQRLTELYAEAGLIGFRVHKRVGGYLMNFLDISLVVSPHTLESLNGDSKIIRKLA
jgi:predicted phage gp36 major capsid-like protein